MHTKGEVGGVGGYGVSCPAALKSYFPLRRGKRVGFQSFQGA